MNKQDEDKFYIMASTNAHIGEALETISQPHHESETRMPLLHLIKTTISRFALTMMMTITTLVKRIWR